MARYDWDRFGRPGVAAVNRIGGRLLAFLTCVVWVMFLYGAIAWDWTLVFVPLLVTAGTAAHRIGLRQVYGVKEPPEAVKHQPRQPSDLDRPYPRPRGGRRKLDRICPACGTGDETGALDGRIQGWRAHRSCSEWLGDWRPPQPEISGQPPAAPPQPRTSGLASVSEVREQVIMAFSVPAPQLGPAEPPQEPFTEPCPDCGQAVTFRLEYRDDFMRAHRGSWRCQQRIRNQRAVTEWCTCGKRFELPAANLAAALVAHHASGKCPHATWPAN